jgi:hypothetical protein
VATNLILALNLTGQFDYWEEFQMLRKVPWYDDFAEGLKKTVWIRESLSEARNSVVI